MVSPEITELVAAASALISTIEPGELYQGKESPPNLDQHKREAVARAIAALSHVSRLYPTFKAFKVRRHIIYPTVEGGKIVAVDVIPANSILDVNSMLEADARPR